VDRRRLLIACFVMTRSPIRSKALPLRGLATPTGLLCPVVSRSSITSSISSAASVINTAMTNQIWEFTPTANAWVLKNAVLPVPRGYLPTVTYGAFIYTAGGSNWNGTTLVDTSDSFQYDPVADSITTIPNIPRATAETRALKFAGPIAPCSPIWVMGGGGMPPNPSDEVDTFCPEGPRPRGGWVRRSLQRGAISRPILTSGTHPSARPTSGWQVAMPVMESRRLSRWRSTVMWCQRLASRRLRRPQDREFRGLAPHQHRARNFWARAVGCPLRRIWT